MFFVRPFVLGKRVMASSEVVSFGGVSTSNACILAASFIHTNCSMDLRCTNTGVVSVGVYNNWTPAQILNQAQQYSQGRYNPDEVFISI